MISFPYQKKQQRLLIILIAIVLIIIAVLYFGLRSPQPASPEEALIGPEKMIGGPEEIVEPLPSAIKEKSIQEIDLDTSFLKTPLFQALKTYIQWPIKIGIKGRENPFLPY